MIRVVTDHAPLTSRLVEWPPVLPICRLGLCSLNPGTWRSSLIQCSKMLSLPRNNHMHTEHCCRYLDVMTKLQLVPRHLSRLESETAMETMYSEHLMSKEPSHC